MDNSAAPQLIAVEQPCIRCGYSLRGLAPTGLCPECGTPIERSLRGDLLIYSDPGYITQLLRGTKLIMLSVLLLVVFSLTTGAGRSIAGVGALLEVLSFGNSLLFLLGWWLLTTPDAGQLTSNKGEKPRQIVRVTALISAGISLIARALSLTGLADPMLAAALGLASTLATGVGFFAGMIYLRWLTPRIPDLKAFGRAKTLMIMLPIVLVSYGVVAALGLATTLRTIAPAARPAAAPWMSLAIVALVAGIAGLAILIMYYNLFSWLRKSLLAVQTQQRLTEQPSAAPHA